MWGHIFGGPEAVFVLPPSRAGPAYGLGRNIALFQTSLQSFTTPPTHMRVKQKKYLL